MSRTGTDWRVLELRTAGVGRSAGNKGADESGGSGSKTRLQLMCCALVVTLVSYFGRRKRRRRFQAKRTKGADRT
jgi:hypothetical protein